MKLNFENEEAVNNYASDITNKIYNVLEELENQYRLTGKVSKDTYNNLKSYKYYLAFSIRIGEKELANDFSKEIRDINELYILKEMSFNMKSLRRRVNYLYHVLSNVNKSLAFYSKNIDYSKIIKKK